MLALAGFLLTGCRLVAPFEAPAPIPVEAETAFAEAEIHLREGGDGAALRARAAAQRAARLAPRWVAPQRVVDDVDRMLLVGPELLARYEDRLAADRNDTFALYLLGRLEPAERGLERFERAIAVDPSFAWGHHGLAWARARTSDLRGAVEAQERAVACARGSWERSYFADSLARHLAAMGKDMAALGILLDRLEDDDVLQSDRVALGVRAALFELERPFGKASKRGVRRALECLRIGGTTESETRDLVEVLVRAVPSGVVALPEIRAALQSVGGPAREELLGLLLLRESPSPLAVALLGRALGADRSALALNPAFRSARLAVGEVGAPIEEWLALQPKFVLTASGLPRDASLARIVLDARRAEASRGDVPRFAAELVGLGDAFVAAGWFEDAAGLAKELARHDLDRALALDARATAGLVLVHSLVDVMERVDAREPIHLGANDDPASGEVRAANLARLLVALEPRFQRFRDGAREGGAIPEVELSHSPRLRYGPVGSVVHPGPRFSDEDESLGLGRAGDSVGGLAREFEDIGRFAVFGEALGSGPDGTVLRRLLVEERAGELLGTKWSGTVAWCDGADVLSRPGRRGARIGGAALHEGYWIDVGTLRGEAKRFGALGERFLDASGELRVRALEPQALPLRVPGDLRVQRPLLGEADRVRLAVLAERARLGDDGAKTSELVSLDELVLATATHEEGHLCDRTRFLPLGRRFLSVMMFFVESGFSASRVEERLEYRAQLTALCETSETRLPLAEILAAAEEGAGGITPHGAAYTTLLEDFVAELARAVERAPASFASLDGERSLVHQLHRLSRDEVRAVALRLARREGLVSDQGGEDFVRFGEE